MLSLDLVRLQRVGALEVSGVIPVDDEVWAAVEGEVTEPVQVEGRATQTPTRQVIVRVRVEGEMAYTCRRCLERSTRPIHESLDLVWTEPDELLEEGDAADDELRVLAPDVSELDLAAAIREELLLRVPRWVVCQEGCAGLCPRCGINRNLESCECTLDEADPRWDALRALKLEERK